MDENAGQNPDLPLTEATYYILLSLSGGPQHGYAIMKAAEQLSGSRVQLSTGTLYGALTRLLAAGIIARVDEESPPEDGRGRKAYVLTESGRRLLRAEVVRLEEMVRAARGWLAGEGSA